MIKQLRFTIPGAPKGKARPRVTRTGHAYTPKETASYENLVRVCFSETYPDWIPRDTRVSAYIDAYYPIPKSFSKTKREQAIEGYIDPTKKPDLDNIAKGVLDSLNTIAYNDDSQVVYMAISKNYGEIPRVDVTLEIEEDK